MVQSIEDYSLQNISNQINLRIGQASALYIRSPIFLRWAIHHVSMYFPGRTVFRFLPREKRSCFLGKNTIFPDSTRKIMCQLGPFWKDHLFRRPEENIIFSCIFQERSSFIFRLTCNIIFLGKRNISSFPIIQERSYFGAIILGRPSFQDVRKKKIWFSVQCLGFPLLTNKT